MPEWLIAAVCLPVSCWMTGLLRTYAVKSSLLDVPNSRSSHTRPTPRGGGLAIVITFLGALCCLYFTGKVTGSFFQALFGGGLLVAVAGFLDDHMNLPVRWRLLAHFAAAGLVFLLLDGLPVIQVDKYYWHLDWVGTILGVVSLVWIMNLFNFMDGIDGIASIEAISIAGGAGALIWLAKGATASFYPLIALATATAGFLWWNRPPARIFLGDSGSVFLGFTLGSIALYNIADSGSTLTIWPWAILFAVFITDATVTLTRRMVGRKRWYAAHRSHVYQKWATEWGSHLKVTVTVLFINWIWLFPLAALALVLPAFACYLTLIAYAPLIILALVSGAGKDEIAS